MPQGLFSHHFILYEWANKLEWLERLTSDQHSSLLDSLISYEENEVLLSPRF